MSRFREGRDQTYKTWLLVKVDRYQAEQFDDLFEWVSRQAQLLLPIIPVGLTEAMISVIAKSPEKFGHQGKSGQYVFGERDTELVAWPKIVAYPRIGMFCIRAPGGEVATALRTSKITAMWNWGTHAAPYGDGTATFSNGINVQDLPGVSALWEKYGRGAGVTIGIIDSGVCKNSRELEGRCQHLTVLEDPDGGFEIKNNHSLLRILPHHGTAAGSIAAGRTLGIAPEANLFSIALPVRGDGRLNMMSILDIIDAILGNVLSKVSRDPLRPEREDLRLRDLLDVLIFPIGITNLTAKEDKIVAKAIEVALMELAADHGIVCVASVGDGPEVAFPAICDSVLGVGALKQDGKTSADEYSAVGIALSGRAKPDIRVIGEDVMGECARLSPDQQEAIASYTGTSFSAAIVGGVAALLSSQYSNRTNLKKIIYEMLTNVEDAEHILDLGKI